MRMSGEIDPTTDDEIVQAIANSLKPWKSRLRQLDTGYLVEKSDEELLAEISTSVRAEIDRLRNNTVPNFFGRDAIRKTRDDARDILKSIDQLKEQLSAKTLSPELRLRLGLDIPLTGDPSEITNMPVPRLLEALRIMRDLCQAAADNQPDADQVKLWCVRTALRLVLRFAKNRPSAGSDQTAYCIIAGLLYQGLTGKEQHLRRICQDVLRPYLSLLPT
jgi:hypothetical protein